MAVAKWRSSGGTWSHERNFHPPKRASFDHWYREAIKALGSATITFDIPKYGTVQSEIKVDEDTIIFEMPAGTLFIARKRNLR